MYVCLCLCASVYICMCVNVCICVNLCFCVYVCISVYVCVCIYVCASMCMCIYVRVSMCICMCVNVWVYVHMCVYMYESVHLCVCMCVCVQLCACRYTCVVACVWRSENNLRCWSSPAIMFEGGLLVVFLLSTSHDLPRIFLPPISLRKFWDQRSMLTWLALCGFFTYWATSLALGLSLIYFSILHTKDHLRVNVELPTVG